MASRELTNMESVLSTVFEIFNRTVNRDNRKITLTPGEFKELVHKELPHFTKNVRDLDEKMRSLDVNKDKMLEFGEYWQLLGELVKENEGEELGQK